ncbi:hypothetical protein RJT34_24938 [Clitoria ternatea]|uniref:Ubiquitin-like domain-containing protein n=1 Tax=Clitoria ternatea TaxID=43366 RepID=A0AAN9IIG1_CLITE
MDNPLKFDHEENYKVLCKEIKLRINGSRENSYYYKLNQFIKGSLKEYTSSTVIAYDITIGFNVDCNKEITIVLKSSVSEISSNAQVEESKATKNGFQLEASLSKALNKELEVSLVMVKTCEVTKRVRVSIPFSSSIQLSSAGLDSLLVFWTDDAIGGDIAAEGATTESNTTTADGVSINICCSNGSKFSIQIRLNSTVISFKDVIVRNCDIPVDQQCLIYKGIICQHIRGMVLEILSDLILEKLKAPPKLDDVPDIRPEQLVEADAFIFGFPSLFGMMPSQLKAFFHATSELWASQALIGIPDGIFGSTGFHGRDQELSA